MPVRIVPLTVDGGTSFGIQSPDDRLDYAFDCCLDLRSHETLLSPSIEVSPGDLLVDSATVHGGRILVWIEGGTPATTYSITATVSTSHGRILLGVASLFVGPVGLDDPSVVAAVG